MSQKIFKISIIIFYISLAVAILAITSNLGIIEDILNDPAYSNPLGDSIRAIVKGLKIIDVFAYFVCVISGITSYLTRKPIKII